MEKHEFDAFSFIFGMAFSAIGLRLLLSDGSLVDQSWLWPGFLVVSGAVLIFVAARRSRRGTREAESLESPSIPDYPV